MSPKEILARADEARGNSEGMEWQIDISSVEGGRQQERTIRVTARSFNCRFWSPRMSGARRC